MLQTHSNTQLAAVQDPDRPVHEVPLPELERRAGALAKELGRQYSFSAAEWRVHWADLLQTALLAFLENRERPLAYAYAVARTALQDYAWVHLRGLNGGWKSLAARDYTLVDTRHSIDFLTDEEETGLALDHWRPATRDWERTPRPVEWAVQRREADPPPEAADLFRDLLIVLVGMTTGRWYPEQLYRAALLLALRLAGHTVADQAAALNLEEDEVAMLYQSYRADYLRPFLALHPLGQETMRLRGRLRVQWFETLRPGWLRRPLRKMVVLPHGIYTITYKKSRSQAGGTWGSLQKGRRVNGRVVVRQVSLGATEQITKEILWQKSLALERKLAGLVAAGAENLGRINESRRVMFGVI